MSSVVALRPDRQTFPVVDCPACHTRSLTWLDYSGDEELLRCLGCNAPAGGEVVIVGRRTLSALGYVLFGEKKKAKASKPSKCGASGVRGCGSGGCSSGGSCGTGGGCSGGGCG